MPKDFRKKALIEFPVTLVLVLVLFAVSVVKTGVYNRALHQASYTGSALFSPEVEQDADIAVKAIPRGSTWGKVFDFNNEGLTENNYQAYTYDVTVTNNTRDKVSYFTFKWTFRKEAYLSSGWNGAVEIHQLVNGGELVSTVPDLREFDPADYALETVEVDGEALIVLNSGDYFVYYPSASTNAMEVPIKPREGTTPGFILYVANGENLDDSILDLEYRFHRQLGSEPLFWIAVAGLGIWAVGLIVLGVTASQIKKYTERHERDNKIINESIETFTGFIDAKDPYTNGHSKRVAIYTRSIAEAMGYEGEELDRIYYIALLHDCGKIGVPDNILRKPGKLTDEEFEIIKSHTVRGGEILSRFKSLKNVGEGALYHHERYDGSGYPEGRAGEDIPLIARMICVADSFDAMNSNRVYRKKLTREYIIGEIEKNKGRQFDPKIADVMLRLLRENKLPVEACV